MVGGNGDFRPVSSVNDRNRGAPVALARNQPVPQSVGSSALTGSVLFEHVDHRRDGVGLAQSVERTRIDVRPVARCRDESDGGVVGFVRRNIHNDPNGKFVFESEIEVALVVRGNSHDGSRTVVREDIIGRPNRHPLAVHGVDCVAPEEHPGLVAGRVLSFDLSLLLNFLEIGHERHPNGRFGLGYEFTREVGIGCDDHERRSVQRVGAGREDRHSAVAALDRDHDLRTA